MTNMTYKLCIIGSGINGLATALCLAKQFVKSQLTVVAADFPPYTTSDHGFGIVMNSVKNSSLNHPMANEFVNVTINHCKQMDKEMAEDAGIQRVTTTFLSYEIDEGSIQQSKNITSGALDCRLLSQDEMKQRRFVVENKSLELIFRKNLNKSECLKAYEASYFAIDTSLYLPWLMQQLRLLIDRNGGQRVRFERRKLSSLSELGQCDLIVNCSGLGARELVNDHQVVPIRGQYLRVDLNDKWCFYSAGCSIVPRFNDLCLGSLKQIGRWDLEVDPDDTEKILEKCEVILPEVRRAKILKTGVALRPGRIEGARIELEQPDDRGNFSAPVIHNYGHGAGGISQHWGCALKVLELAKQCFPAARL